MNDLLDLDTASVAAPLRKSELLPELAPPEFDRPTRSLALGFYRQTRLHLCRIERRLFHIALNDVRRCRRERGTRVMTVLAARRARPAVARLRVALA